MSHNEVRIANLNKRNTTKRSRGCREKHVQFPQELVFNDLVKDGDSKEMITFLRRQSVEIDLNRFNDHGTTALTDLIHTGNLKCVRVLVSLGADVNQRDAYGLTALHHTTIAGYLHIARFLVDQGANPDCYDSKGFSPVDYTDDFEMIELLTMNSPSAQCYSPENFYDELMAN